MALDYLYRLRVIHRDVKPSNILINRGGQVKMCDFGVSGYLVDSVAKTVQAGCKPYMAVSFRKILVVSPMIITFSEHIWINLNVYMIFSHRMFLNLKQGC